LTQSTPDRRARVLVIPAAAFLLLAAAPLRAAEPVPLSQYLGYARASADWTWNHWDDIIDRWKKSFDPKNVFGYRPPGGLLEMAVIDSYFYEKDRKPELAARAKSVLLGYGRFRSQYPDWARKARPDYEEVLPALPDFFTAMRYVRAYDTLKKFRLFSTEETAAVETLIADSMAYLLRTQEWGPMNRSALRAETLAWACRALPGHPQAATWDMQRLALGDDNWGRWEIEDATVYHGVWLYALCGYADALGRMAELFETPAMYYYARYFLQLMGPDHMVPDFGDAHRHSSWQLFLVFFEAAAAQYGDPGLKWAASAIARKFIDFKNPTSVGLGYNLLDCARFGTDRVKPVPPSNLSSEVLDDVLGKKIVFRSGWDPEATYMLLNYKDEGDSGRLFRDYLSDTIPIEEEKVTHGHSDENGIVLLMSGGSTLLHDGGYRDTMPSGPFGAYRQDYFHNRLCVRPEKMFLGQGPDGTRYSVREAVPGQGLLEFLRNAGSHRDVPTEKIDFLSFPDFDYSRTRVRDDSRGYEADRVVVYIKDPEMFVVFDILKSLRQEYFTLSQLWHTRQVLSRGEGWFDTRYDKIQNETLPDTKNLLIIFPRNGFRMEGVEPETRHYQDESLIHQTASRRFEMTETATLAAVLIPHSSSESPESVLERISLVRVNSPSEAFGLRIRAGSAEFTVAAKTDLRREMVRDAPRPKYTYDSGKFSFGGFETNGDFIFGRVEGSGLAYTIINLTKALYQGQILFEAQPSTFGLAFDGSPDGPGVGKVRYWRGKADFGGQPSAGAGRSSCPK